MVPYSQHDEDYEYLDQPLTLDVHYLTRYPCVQPFDSNEYGAWYREAYAQAHIQLFEAIALGDLLQLPIHFSRYDTLFRPGVDEHQDIQELVGYVASGVLRVINESTHTQCYILEYGYVRIGSICLRFDAQSETIYVSNLFVRRELLHSGYITRFLEHIFSLNEYRTYKFLGFELEPGVRGNVPNLIGRLFHLRRIAKDPYAITESLHLQLFAGMLQCEALLLAQLYINWNASPDMLKRLAMVPVLPYGDPLITTAARYVAEAAGVSNQEPEFLRKYVSLYFKQFRNRRRRIAAITRVDITQHHEIPPESCHAASRPVYGFA